MRQARASLHGPASGNVTRAEQPPLSGVACAVCGPASEAIHDPDRPDRENSVNQDGHPQDRRLAISRVAINDDCGGFAAHGCDEGGNGRDPRRFTQTLEHPIWSIGNGFRSLQGSRVTAVAWASVRHRKRFSVARPRQPKRRAFVRRRTTGFRVALGPHALPGGRPKPERYARTGFPNTSDESA